MAKTPEKSLNTTKSRFCRGKEKNDTKTQKLLAKQPKTAPKHPENPNRSQSAACVPKIPCPAFPRYFPGISPAFPRLFPGIFGEFVDFLVFFGVFGVFFGVLAIFSFFSLSSLLWACSSHFCLISSVFGHFFSISTKLPGRGCRTMFYFFLSVRIFSRTFPKIDCKQGDLCHNWGEFANFHCPSIFFRKCAVNVVYENLAKKSYVTFLPEILLSTQSPSTTFNEASAHPQQDLDSAGQLYWRASPHGGNSHVSV